MAKWTAGNDPLSTAKRICEAHKRALDNETFYCLAREMMVECFNVMQLQLAEWRNTKRRDPYAPKGRQYVTPPPERKMETMTNTELLRHLEKNVTANPVPGGTETVNSTPLDNPAPVSRVGHMFKTAPVSSESHSD